MRRFWAVLAVMLAGLASIAPASGQDTLYFPVESFGSANKRFSESSANQKQLEVLMSKQDVFENVFDLEDQDIFRRAGRAVGMLDLLVRLADGQQVNTTCTATLIAPDRAITNYHCVPGIDFRTLDAQLRLGFLDRVNAPGQGYKVRLPAIEANKALDYAIVAVEGVPASRFPPIGFSAVAPRDRQSLYLLHHPAGQPQRLTRLRCQAGQPAINPEGDLLHHCDTLGGSSGALVLAVENGRVTGLHKAGVPDPVRPFNLATPAPKLFAASTELKRLANAAAPAPTPATVTRPAEPQGWVNAKTAPASVQAPLVRDPSSLPDFALFRECEGCPEMVVIPGGSFLMGSPAGEPGRDDGDEEQVSVSLGRFAVSRFPVTRGEYAAFSAATSRAVEGGCYTDRAQKGSWAPDPSGTWRDPAFAQTDRHPVVCVNWADASAFAAWTQRRTGQPYRLISEAEYEYSNRAGTPTAYFWGADINRGCVFANVADATAKAAFSGWTTAACNDGYERTSPVGAFRANPWGLFDATGNVWSWTADCYEASYANNPKDGSATTTSNCASRVFRGGSWSDNPQDLRAALRDRKAPSNRDSDLGFRLARTL